MRARILAVGTAVLAVGLGVLPASAAPGAKAPARSDFFATLRTDESRTVGSPSDGDLWPSCWSDDNAVYAAHGDGRGFSPDLPSTDIGVNRISGTPEADDLTGTRLAAGDQVGQIWSGPDFNRKPTGMACVDGDLYLAVQDLAKHTFDRAPAATIVKSSDHGRTWTWDRSAPMFDGATFTTVMFLDFGRDYANAIDEYVYAYGLDHNWRQQSDVFLARVPRTSIQDRSAWQFYTGTRPTAPTWSYDIDARTPVIHDEERVYADLHVGDGAGGKLPIAQGGVVYNKPLDRYFYLSWNAFQWTLYEAPKPWGPWRKTTAKDFGVQPWTTAKHGGYATTVPSKFISADGKRMWVQANLCAPCGVSPDTAYNFNLRRLDVEPLRPTVPDNTRDPDRNLALEPGTTPFERVTRNGRTSSYNDGDLESHEDDWNNENKLSSWWGYTWPRRYRVNEVRYTTGQMLDDGGWFASDLRVQVRRDGRWHDVEGQRVTPRYPYDSSAGPHRTFGFRFDATVADGIRVIGQPGGTHTYTSVAELETYYL